MMIDPQNPGRINLPLFEGPLDLLLYLIRKNEIDIWDIPIAPITEEYLRVLELMSELDLDVAGEFLLMAATLTTIKSRMLLPPDPNAPPDQSDDPRSELVERLLEYQRYREAAERLAKGEILHRDVFERGQQAAYLPEGEAAVYPDVSLFDLLSALHDALERAKLLGHVHQISAERFSVVERIHWLHDLIKEKGRWTFRRLFADLNTRMEIVVTFLALLEMLKANILSLQAVVTVSSPLDVDGEADEQLSPLVPLINDLEFEIIVRDAGNLLAMDFEGLE